MKSWIGNYFSGLCAALLLVGCGGDSSSNISSTDSDNVQISGAGIKGPLAFADVKIYKLDPSIPGYYDKTSPISIAITNQYAEINGLSVSRKIKPPFILAIDGSNGIDLNTGVAPTIDTLITVITDDLLVSNRPIFATPLTTLVFHMARLDTENRSYKNKREKSKAFSQKINSATNIVSSTFAVGQYRNIDLFRAPLVINDYTTEPADQELAVYHRAAVEAFAAKVYALSLLGDTSSDTIIENLALDFHNDGAIDNSDNGAFIGNIDPVVLSQDPMKLLIPNTPYTIEEIMLLMEEERLLLGTNMSPPFLIDEIAFPEATTSTEGSTPNVTLSLKSIDFGSQTVGGTSNPIELVLTNSGTAPLNISGISISSGFIQSNNCSDNVPAGGNCVFDIQFIPASAGNVTGTLKVISNTISSPDAVNLAGTGVLYSEPEPTPIEDSPYVDPNNPNVQLYHDINNEELGTYTLADALDTWGSLYSTVFNGGLEIVNDPESGGNHGKALQAFYAANEYGYNDSNGGQWLKNLDNYNELYIAMDVYFEPGFEFVKSGKLGPSVRSTNWIDKYANGQPAGTRPDGTDFWSAALSWYFDGELQAYVYHAEGPSKYGEHVSWDDGADGQKTYLTPGKWHRIEVRVKLNTPGILDGSLQGWINGEKRLDRSDMMFRMPGGEHLKIGTYMFYTFMGGNDSTFAPSKNQHSYFDNFVISTQPITH